MRAAKALASLCTCADSPEPFLLDVAISTEITCNETINGPLRETTFYGGHTVANNTGTDQPALPRSLISAFVIRFLESIICKLAAGEISIFKLVSVAAEKGFKRTMSKIPKTGFLATSPK